MPSTLQVGFPCCRQPSGMAAVAAVSTVHKMAQVWSWQNCLMEKVAGQVLCVVGRVGELKWEWGVQATKAWGSCRQHPWCLCCVRGDQTLWSGNTPVPCNGAWASASWARSSWVLCWANKQVSAGAGMPSGVSLGKGSPPQCAQVGQNSSLCVLVLVFSSSNSGSEASRHISRPDPCGQGCRRVLRKAVGLGMGVGDYKRNWVRGSGG